MNDKRAPADPIVATRTKTRNQPEVRRVPPYHVVLENDDYHSAEFVVEVLCKALGYHKERSVQLTLQAHHTGRAIVWTGPREVAELKAEQMRTFHEMRNGDRDSLGPVHCTIEPAPGG